MAAQRNTEQFKQTFREEAPEILVDLEAALLELNENRDDAELVGRVFRGLHTIKGSGAMFGFDELAAFTHKLENAFDAVRNGELHVTTDLVDLTLGALDQMKAMLEAESGGQASDAAACADILARLAALTGTGPEAAGPAPAEAPAEAPAPGAPTQANADMKRWRIHFAPGPEFLLNGSNPLLLIRELRQLGDLTTTADLTAVPPLAQIDSERCYVNWDLLLSTTAGLDAIRDVFIFVEDHCELKIEPVADSEANAGKAPADVVARGLQEPRNPSGGRRSYDKPETATSLRVPAAKLDQFVDLVGELVTVQARLSQVALRCTDSEVAAVAEEVERLTASLRESSMNMRMMPVRGTFEKFRRLVHDLARDLGKNVELAIEGADTELDKTVIEQLGDPLMHLIRNSMDHGIEMPDERIARGKSPMATIKLSARHSGASVLIEVSDDGAGINAEAVRNRAIERGLIAADASLSEGELYGLIFRPGFSTAKQVTDISGRGVGMDVVRQRVEGLRGTIEVHSEHGGGTTVTLQLPLTLAIIDGLLVAVGDAYFVLPVASVVECVELTRSDIERANGKTLAEVRGDLVPYIRLRDEFCLRGSRPEIEQIMLVQTEEGRYGFVVDQVLGDCQTVIKSLGRFYRHVQTVSGATILGDGTVALILDAHRLVHNAVRRQQSREERRRAVSISSSPRAA